MEVDGSPVIVAPALAHTDVVEESSRGSATAVDPVAQRQSSNTGSTPARRVQLEKVTAATSVAVSASAIAAVAQQTGCFPCCYSGGEFQPTQPDPADASVPVDTTIYNDFTGQDHHQNCWSATPSR